MGNKTLNVRIILKNDVAVNWTSKNPVLLKGEIGNESDTGKFKIGDGSSEWSALSYYKNLPDADYLNLQTLIEMMNNDKFGKVDDVKVNNESVLNNKIANITIGNLTFSAEEQSITNGKFTENVVLHKIAKTGKYDDLIGKVDVINTLDSEDIANALSAKQGKELRKMIQGLTFAKSFTNIEDMITKVNALPKGSMGIGVNLFINATEVPDFWVYSVEETNTPYVYTDDKTFINAVSTQGSIQVGNFKIAMLETRKVDLSDYATVEYVNGIKTTLEDRINAIENDTSILKDTDSFVLDGGNSVLGA